MAEERHADPSRFAWAAMFAASCVGAAYGLSVLTPLGQDLENLADKAPA